MKLFIYKYYSRILKTNNISIMLKCESNNNKVYLMLFIEIECT